MAYKYSKGKTFQGDIYNEDDAQGNTYLDWSDDAIGLVAGGALTLAVSGAVVNVSGSGTPLRVDGAISSSGIIFGTDLYLNTNNASTQTTIYVQGNSGTEFYSLGTGGFNLTSGGEIKLLAGADSALHLGTNAADSKAVITSGGDVGIGTATPNSTFQVSGSQAGNLLTVGDANATLDETHHIVQFTDATGGQKCILPAANTCGGRTYHIFNQTGGGEGGTISVNVADSSGDTIDGNDEIELAASEGNMSISVVSNGSDGWMIFGQYSQHDEGG